MLTITEEKGNRVDAVANTKAHFIWIKGDPTPTICREDERVLYALERDGRAGPKAVRVGCRQGGCGACRVRIVSGGFETGKMSRAHVTKEEQDQGYVLSCRLYPRSDLVLVPAFAGPRRATKTR
ncbi:2Fe-2S iron-sulfur cluster binding domain-containing protein [Ruegeria sp. PrR005]|uniref:2Fe-2S iron-sulfur cluster binding domain-containing protein n=1 Tax=Ruegeria sp. PrR005 TaxID=2706882 RepID=A0A6B2NKJ1_9RHOB|nr:2Fe-2S iron-sulfur cluster binding domain-containing protein [Ruegeria sp. PrR005]NDW43878.1 2Fe-2S iron-sulfur cluster binding domain-containing protein [Ruegeria sp. PrR005]